MDFIQSAGFLLIIVWVVLVALALLILYSIIRRAVAAGLRDHQLWMEKNRPSPGYSISPRRPLE